MKNTRVKEEQKYGIVSNISYALGNIWRWDKAFYLYFIPNIPLSILLPLASIYFPKLLIDSIEQSRPLETVMIMIAVYFTAIFLFDILKRFCNSRLGMRQYNFSTLYQNIMTEKYMRTDYSNTDNPDINVLYRHAMNDACSGQCAPEFIWRTLLQFLINILGVFTYGSLIGVLSPLILLLLITSSCVTYFINRWQRNYTEKNKDKWAVIDRKIGYLSGFSSKFEYAKDIRIYGMLGWLNRLLGGYQKDRFEWTKKVSLKSFEGKIIEAFLTLLRDGAAYFVLISMLLDGRIGVGDFVFYFSAVTSFSVWLGSIAGNINDIVSKSIKIGYYRDYFGIEERYNHGKGCPLPSPDELPPEIEFVNVSYRYGKNDMYALKNINLTIGRGEKIAVVGENGAGKTTLVKLLCGLYYPTEGEIKVNGKPVTDYNIEEYYTLFSAVFQDIYLLPVPIAEFISSFDENGADRERVKEVLDKSGLGDKIESLNTGMDTRLMKGVFEDSTDLSGGEKQKLMLARALYKNAPVTVLDEPTAALDPIAENELYMKYGDLTKGKTSVYISHRLSSTRFCDRIIFIEKGEIAETGSHDQLMRQNGRYAYMYGLQSHYYREAVENAKI